MKSRNLVFAGLAWLQLVISVLLAAAIVWGYITYQASTGQFISSLAASVGAVSTVVVRTSETVEARQEMLDDSQKMIGVTRNLVVQLKAMAENQAKLGPQYGAGLNAAAGFLSKGSGPLQIIGETMMDVAVPTGVRFEGIKPVFSTTKPFADQGRQLWEAAREVKVAGESLARISNSIGDDGKKLNSAFIETIDQALKLIGETEKTVVRVKTQDLPKAISDLKTTSEKLHSISTQLGTVSHAGVVVLVVGLLLASWCVMHSLGALLLSKSDAFVQAPKNPPQSSALDTRSTK